MPSFTEAEEPKPNILQVELAPAAVPKLAPPASAVAPEPTPEPVKPIIEPKPVEPKPAPVPKPEPKPIPQPVIKPQSKPVEQVTPPPAETPAPAAEVEPAAPHVPEIISVPAPAAPAPVVTAPTPPIPAPAPLPEPAGPSQHDLEAARRLYGSLLSQSIAKYKQYPKIAQMRGWEGEVLLEVHCDEKGQVISTEVKKSSGHKVLDDQAITMVKKAAPLPQPPEILRSGKKLVILVPVPFSLEAS